MSNSSRQGNAGRTAPGSAKDTTPDPGSNGPANAKPRGARPVSRRALLTGATSAGALGLAGAYTGRLSPAQASPRPLQVLAWPKHLPAEVLDAFTASTGIKVEVTEVNSNEAIINRLSAGGSDAQFDICSPSSTRALDWAATDLLQPWRTDSIEGIEHLNPRMLEFADREWRLQGKGPYWLPYTWGAEAIGWRTDAYELGGRLPSYGDVWQPPGRGERPRVSVSPYSGLVGAGLYLERIGELPEGATWSTYQTEERFREVFDSVMAWTTERQRHLRVHFWRDADTQREGFISEQVSIGQLWDGPTLALRKAGLPIAFQAPHEGALAWQNGFSLVARTPMADAAHALMSFLCDPQMAGRAIDSHGYNSAAIGAEHHASVKFREQFEASFPGDAVRRLNLWPPEPPWYLALRVQYRNDLMQAAVSA